MTVFLPKFAEMRAAQQETGGITGDYCQAGGGGGLSRSLNLVASSRRRKDPASLVDLPLWKWYSALGRGDEEQYLPKDVSEPACRA